MLKTMLTLSLFISASSFAREAGLDPVTKVQDASLICGKVDGKHIIFSAKHKKVWYLFSSAQTDRLRKSITRSADVEGLDAYTYSLNQATEPFPKMEGGGIVVTYQLTYGRNSSFLLVRKDVNGATRLFKGEDGRNGLCHSLN